jgi:hypothetical protein
MAAEAHEGLMLILRQQWRPARVWIVGRLGGRAG